MSDLGEFLASAVKTCLKKGMSPPLTFVLVGINGSVYVTRYFRNESGELDAVEIRIEQRHRRVVDERMRVIDQHLDLPDLDVGLVTDQLLEIGALPLEAGEVRLVVAGNREIRRVAHGS